MSDKEKVIKGLEYCKKYGALGGNDCNGHYEYTDNLRDIIKANNHRKDCPYGQCKTGCVVTLIDDALFLLKEQEPIMIKTVMINGSGRNGRCQNCLMMLNEMDYPNFCGNCGQAVKWE